MNTNMSQSQNMMNKFPEDIIRKIISKFGNYKDLIQFKNTCKKVKNTVIENYDIKHYKILTVSYTPLKIFNFFC